MILILSHTGYVCKNKLKSMPIKGTGKEDKMWLISRHRTCAADR